MHLLQGMRDENLRVLYNYKIEHAGPVFIWLALPI